MRIIKTVIFISIFLLGVTQMKAEEKDLSDSIHGIWNLNKGDKMAEFLGYKKPVTKASLYLMINEDKMEGNVYFEKTEKIGNKVLNAYYKEPVKVKIKKIDKYEYAIVYKGKERKFRIKYRELKKGAVLYFYDTGNIENMDVGGFFDGQIVYGNRFYDEKKILEMLDEYMKNDNELGACEEDGTCHD